MEKDNTSKTFGYDYITGKTPIIISAPHAVVHKRKGKEKYAEPQTKDIAELLNTTLSTHAIIKNNDDTHDANSEKESYFRQKIIQIINNQEKYDPIICGLDIHQCSPAREQDLIIGTNYGKNIHNNYCLIDIINNINNDYNYNIVIDDIFPATGQYRVASEVSQKTGTPYMQIEINSGLFFKKERREKIEKFMIDITKEILDKNR